ncbi:MAG: hypothetical protein AVDCRST_MAG35-2611, partial [uncultured Quadrisphaera sp.]
AAHRAPLHPRAAGGAERLHRAHRRPGAHHRAARDHVLRPGHDRAGLRPAARRRLHDRGLHRLAVRAAGLGRGPRPVGGQPVRHLRRARRRRRPARAPGRAALGPRLRPPGGHGRAVGPPLGLGPHRARLPGRRPGAPGPAPAADPRRAGRGRPRRRPAHGGRGGRRLRHRRARNQLVVDGGRRVHDPVRPRGRARLPPRGRRPRARGGRRGVAGVPRALDRHGARGGTAAVDRPDLAGLRLAPAHRARRPLLRHVLDGARRGRARRGPAGVEPGAERPGRRPHLEPGGAVAGDVQPQPAQGRRVAVPAVGDRRRARPAGGGPRLHRAGAPLGAGEQRLPRRGSGEPRLPRDRRRPARERAGRLHPAALVLRHDLRLGAGPAADARRHRPRRGAPGARRPDAPPGL